MAYCKVMVGDQCFGAGSEAECRGIILMHKTVKNGHKKETKASILDFQIVHCEGDYPVYKPIAALTYKPGVRIPSVGELK